MPRERLIGAEIDIQLICTGAATSFIRWYLSFAKVLSIGCGAAVDDLNDDTVPNAVDFCSPLSTLVGDFITQSAIPFRTPGRYVAWRRGLFSSANGQID